MSPNIKNLEQAKTFAKEYTLTMGGSPEDEQVMVDALMQELEEKGNTLSETTDSGTSNSPEKN